MDARDRRDDSRTAANARTVLWLSVLIVALAAAVYLNALDNPFVYDDYRLIVSNPWLGPPPDLGSVLRQDMTRPVVSLSYAADAAMWGRQPFGFHVTNVLLHMLNALLLFAFGRGLGSITLGATAAILLAVHPLMTEAVGYVSGRAEVMSTTFVLLALLSAERWRAGIGWTLATWGCWTLALLSKETAVVLPLLLIGRDLLRRQTAPAEWRARQRALHLPLLLFAALAGAARLYVFLQVEHGGALGVEWTYFWSQADVLRRYLVLLLIPRGQTIFHALSPLEGLFTLRGAGAAATMAALAWMVWILRHRLPTASYGLAWFVVSLLPPAVLVALNRGEPMAEHRLYLASAGFFLAAGAVVERIAGSFADSQRVTRLALAVACAVVVAGLAGRTVLRNAVWASPVALWSEAADLSGRHWLPWLVLGESLHEEGRHAEAVGAFRLGIDRWAEGPALWGNLGVCLIDVGRLDEAAAAFGELQRIEPASVVARAGLTIVAQRRAAVAR